MLEISLKQDDLEIYFSRFPDTIDTAAVVAAVKAVLDAHRAQTESDFGRPNGTSAGTKPVTRLHKKQSNDSTVTVTKNLKAALRAFKTLGQPLQEARDIEEIIKKDSGYRGKNMETIRYLIRQLEAGGYAEKLPNGDRVLTPKGKEAADLYEMELPDFSGKDEEEDQDEREDGDYSPPLPSF
ncbi:hypothetical protein [Deinococcus marmoris]|uniref:hypothetical protein n=1 Tax=Deinococcus marmoris TaxID=249408 RepID=UPI00049768CB|nr:hypothetical protein [Deinococcus marmoris]